MKPSQLVEDPIILEKEKNSGKDGKPYYKFVEEHTDDEQIDPAIETKEVD